MTGAASKAAQNQCTSFTGLRFVEGRRSPTVLRRLTMSADLRLLHSPPEIWCYSGKWFA